MDYSRNNTKFGLVTHNINITAIYSYLYIQIYASLPSLISVYVKKHVYKNMVIELTAWHKSRDGQNYRASFIKTCQVVRYLRIMNPRKCVITMFDFHVSNIVTLRNKEVHGMIEKVSMSYAINNNICDIFSFWRKKTIRF